MPSASRYDKMIFLEQVGRQHTATGVLEVWELVRDFQGSCKYTEQTIRRDDGSSMEVDSFWVIRTRNDVIHQTREVGRYRYRCRIRGQESVFYPRRLPIYNGGEWVVECRDEEDYEEIEAGNAAGAALGVF